MSLWDIFQQIQIQNLRAQQVSGESEAERTTSRSRALGHELNDRVGRVLLVTEAMWDLMSEKLGVTTDELAARVRQIDERQHRLDTERAAEAAAAPPVRCQACQAVVPAGMTKCQFCGKEVPDAKVDPFRV